MSEGSAGMTNGLRRFHRHAGYHPAPQAANRPTRGKLAGPRPHCKATVQGQAFAGHRRTRLAACSRFPSIARRVLKQVMIDHVGGDANLGVEIAFGHQSQGVRRSVVPGQLHLGARHQRRAGRCADRLWRRDQLWASRRGSLRAGAPMSPIPINETTDAARLSYDRMASLLAPYRDPDEGSGCENRGLAHEGRIWPPCFE
jgi:hypothetical protein